MYPDEALNTMPILFLLLPLYCDSIPPVWRGDEVMKSCEQSCSGEFSAFLEAGNLQRVFSESYKPNHLKSILYPKPVVSQLTFKTLFCILKNVL